MIEHDYWTREAKERAAKEAYLTLKGWQPIHWGWAGAFHKDYPVIVYIVRLESNGTFRPQHHVPTVDGTADFVSHRLLADWSNSNPIFDMLYTNVLQWEAGHEPTRC